MNTTRLPQTKRPVARTDKQAMPPAPETNPPGTGASRSLRLDRILVPLDFSESATEALRFALPFARETGARLDLLHVIAPLSLPADTGYLPNEWNEWEEQQSGSAAARLKRLADWAERFVPASVAAEQVVKAGTPYDIINRMALREQVDLIIIATQGRIGLKRLFVGSTAERVVRHAPCPVLVVRERAHESFAESPNKDTARES